MGYISIFDDVIAPVRTELTPLVERLGGYGQMRLVLRVVGAGSVEHPERSESSTLVRLGDTIELRRNVEATPPTSEQTGSMQREVQRATSMLSWEPGPRGAG